MTARTQLTIRLDDTTINYFKSMAKQISMPYQSLINLYLRECAASKRKLSLTWKEKHMISNEIPLRGDYKLYTLQEGELLDVELHDMKDLKILNDLKKLYPEFTVQACVQRDEDGDTTGCCFQVIKENDDDSEVAMLVVPEDW